MHVEFTKDELRIMNNALNKICNGVERPCPNEKEERGRVRPNFSRSVIPRQTECSGDKPILARRKTRLINGIGKLTASCVTVCRVTPARFAARGQCLQPMLELLCHLVPAPKVNGVPASKCLEFRAPFRQRL